MKKKQTRIKKEDLLHPKLEKQIKKTHLLAEKLKASLIELNRMLNETV